MLGTADLDLLDAMMEPLADCPFFAKDRDLRYVAANSAMAEMCGIADRSGLVGLRATDIFSDDRGQHYERLDRKVINSRQGFRHRLELSGGPNSRWLLHSRTPLCNADGDVVGVIGTAQRLHVSDRQSPTYQRLACVIRHLETHFADPLNITLLADMAGISVSQLERDAGRILGAPLREFHHRLRIEYALGRLDAGESIAAVATASGYADQSAFTRRFHSLVGMPPRRYRSARTEQGSH